MADILQIPSCGGTTGTFNSGIPLCDIIRGIPMGLIGLDAGVGFSAAERADNATFVAALITKTRAARGSRAYPFFSLTNFEDKSKEPTKAALGNLTNGEITTNDGIPAFAFQHRIGELFHQKLMEAQNADMTWLIVDKNYVVYGTLDGSTFRGFSLSEFYVALPKFGNLSTASSYQFEMTLESQTEYKENGRFIQSSSALVAATGIRDVVLAATVASSVLSVSLTAIGGKNLTDLYATELGQAGAWEVKKTSSGAAVTVSPAFNSSTGKMDLTLSGTPWTGGSTGDAYTVNLVTPAALKALTSPIDGYESTGIVSFTKPA